MNKKQIKNLIIRLIILGVILTLSYFVSVHTLKFKSNILTNIPSLLGYLLIVTLFIERAIEVVLSTARSEGADNLDRKIERLESELEYFQGTGTKTEILDAEIKLSEAKDERTEFRGDSRSWANWIGIFLSTMVALIGVRIIGNILESNYLQGPEKRLFVLIDVLFTGLVLAGGSEAINKIFKLYNSFMAQNLKRVGERDKELSKKETELEARKRKLEEQENKSTSRKKPHKE